MSDLYSNLQPETRRWARKIVQIWQLEEHHERILVLAGQAWESAETARARIATDGAFYVDRFGAPHAHPAVLVHRQAMETFARLIRELGLDAEATPAAKVDPKRPPQLLRRYK